MYAPSDRVREYSRIVIPKTDGALDRMAPDDHGKLLDYLVSRLQHGNQDRTNILTRYAKVDRAISTWQKLSHEDAMREDEEDNTGRSQAIPINLPILATHLDDTTSFFSELFAPMTNDFYVTPEKDIALPAKELAKKMNRDTKSRRYYSEVSHTFRSLVKYNVGGVAVRWEGGDGVGELASPGNRVEHLDMYNYLYDPSIRDVGRIYCDAEWAARISQKNRLWVTKKGRRGELQRVDRVINPVKEREGYLKNSTKKGAKFYKSPPVQAGLGMDGRDDRQGKGAQIDWAAYGASLENETTVEIDGFEVIEMFCWINPWEFKLASTKGVKKADEELQLWRFIIIDACEVCFAEVVPGRNDGDAVIPHFLSTMTQDDMKGAQRSQMEYMRPFQRFASFLINVYVLSARKNLWGTRGYDPTMFDISETNKGDVAGWFKSKVPGRDVRTGLMHLDSKTGTEMVFETMGQFMSLMQSLFPSQALPSQIAGIDRAVKDQVVSVMQGTVRRLHMTARLIDADMMQPMRLECYQNLAQFDPEGLEGVDEESVAKVLGSGLSQANAEVMAQMIQQMIQWLLQNPETAANYDMAGIFTYWSQTMNSPFDLGSFVNQQPAAGGPADPNLQPGGAPPAGPIPGV